MEGQIGTGTANGLIRAYLDNGEIWFCYIKDARKEGKGMTFNELPSDDNEEKKFNMEEGLYSNGSLSIDKTIESFEENELVKID